MNWRHHLDWLKDYLVYFLTAKNRHGIHSPFVYNLSDVVLKLPISSSAQEELIAYKNDLINSTESIVIEDFGAGSRFLKDKRKISDIARISGSNMKTISLLYRLVNFYQPKRILELGTSLGIATNAMALAAPNASIYSVEGCAATHAQAKKHLAKYQRNNIELHQMNFANFFDQNDQVFDFVFLDGNHREEAVIEMLEKLENFIHDETIILLDDIRWSSGMKRAWQKTIENQNYHVTVDLFKTGLILKRKHQQKEHFLVKY
ncbi:MAG: class I SAM-dependent methyltransferase [Crocinitomicaceae bacterium]|nr:class I SAM-dependent methyltransferase [Crocinitomicaceae bacterium]